MDFVPYARAVMSISATILGAGIVALSSTMKVLGLLGIVSIFLVSALTNASIKILMKFSVASYSYEGVMNDTFGNICSISLKLCVVIHIIATLIVDIIIIHGELFFWPNANGVVRYGVLRRWFEDHKILYGTTNGFLFLASLTMDSLCASCFAVLLAIISFGATAVTSFSKLVNGTLGTRSMPGLLPNVTDINFVRRLFNVIQVLVTAFICHFNVHTIRNELQDPVLMERAVDISLDLCSKAYIIASFFAFILSGNSTPDANIYFDLGTTYFINDFVRILYALHFLFVFPNRIEVLRFNIDGLFPAAWYPNHLNLDHNGRYAIIGVALLAIISAVLKYMPWNVFQIIRVTSAVFIGFIFPALIALRDVHGIATRRERVLSVLMIGFAVFAILATTYIA